MDDKSGSVRADLTTSCRAVTKAGSYMILPQENRVPSTLPNFENTIGQVLTTAANGAKFIAIELHMDENGRTVETIDDEYEHFIYVLEGKISLGIKNAKRDIVEGGFAYLTPDISFQLVNDSNKMSRVLWFRKRYVEIKGKMPNPIFGNEKDYPAMPEDTYTEQHLIPYDDDIAYDLAFNLLNIEPGVHFGFVESHIMEHGLYMLQGRGIYWLNGDYHEVKENDYIYMAPFCPQFYFATGWEKTRYLLYKDINRDYAEGI